MSSRNQPHHVLPVRSTTLALAVVAGLLAARQAHAQQPPPPPTPYEWVSQLDFECRPAEGPPPVPSLLVRQLNPVLKDQIPPTFAQLGPLAQMCVPVAKNNAVPSPRALEVSQWADVACYQATAAPVDVDLRLSHLNPQLAGLPDERVRLTQLRQICLPVRKNNSQIPPAVREVVSHLDLGCYDLEEPTSSADRTLRLSHLNPVIRAMGFDDRIVTMRRAQRLCVPIAKNDEQVPPAVLSLVEWADFLKYRVDLVQGVVPPFPLLLSHLNPLFAQVPPFTTTVAPDPIHLMVPVAKNGHVPPGGPDHP